MTGILYSEEVLKPQLDNYAQPKDLISKPCLPQQRYEGAQEKTVHEIDHGGREVCSLCKLAYSCV